MGLVIPDGRRITPSDLLWVIEEKDEIKIWMHKVNDVLKDLRPKLTINYCSPAELHYYHGTFQVNGIYFMGDNYFAASEK